MKIVFKNNFSFLSQTWIDTSNLFGYKQTYSRFKSNISKGFSPPLRELVMTINDLFEGNMRERFFEKKLLLADT